MGTNKLQSYPLRMEQELRDQLREAAEASGRSMNAEIVHRLELTFSDLIQQDYVQQINDKLATKGFSDYLRDAVDRKIEEMIHEKYQQIAEDIDKMKPIKKD